LSTSRSARLALALLMAFAGVAPAAGQPPDGGPPPSNAERARAAAVEAARLYDGGDLTGSLRLLEQAFSLYPSPKLHFNLGLVQRDLGQPVEAMQSFERFLEGAKDAEPDRLAAAAGHVSELRAALVEIRIEADLADADVIVDGQHRGATSPVRSIWVTPGSHQIVVQKTGVSFAFSQRIEGQAGTMVPVTARLSPLMDVLRPRPNLSGTGAAGSDIPGGRPEAAAQLADRQAPNTRPFYARWWFWAATAGTVAIVSSGVWLAGRDKRRSPCSSGCGLGEFTVNAR
jgi:tetratricopeptide (TPR) repeat protein